MVKSQPKTTNKKQVSSKLQAAWRQVSVSTVWRIEEMPQRQRGRRKEQKCIKELLESVATPNWTFVKTKRSRADREEEIEKRNNIVIPYVTGISETLGKIFNKHKNWMCHSKIAAWFMYV